MTPPLETQAHHLRRPDDEWRERAERAEAALTKMRHALLTVSQVLREGDPYGTFVQDTLWVAPGETLLERVEDALRGTA